MSNGSQRFMGLVRSVQSGRVPINLVNESVMRAVHSAPPRDPRQFLAAKHPKLPEIKDADETPMRKMSQVQLLATTDFLEKKANMDTAVKRTQKALRDLTSARHGALQDMNSKLQKQNEQLKKDMQKTQAKAQEQAMKAQADMAQVQMPGPTPPPAQTPYGNMLAQQQAQAEAAAA